MKDKELRETLQRLDLQINRVNHCIFRIEATTSGLSLKDCPKCEHPVLAQHSLEITATHQARGGLIRDDWGDIFQCLTCGVKFTCFNKGVCEVIE